jgi:DNA polymerase I-like protein with 3'-5' exonuclease and polymerase domains
LELRLIAYTAGAKKLIDWIATGRDTHLENARAMFPEVKILPHDKRVKKPANHHEAMVNKVREAAKPCAYAISYQMPSGRGDDKYPELHKQLLQVFPDLQEEYLLVLVRRFFELHPEIRVWQRNTARALEELGRIELKMNGAFLYLPSTPRGKNQALNFQMQSQGGALINRAIIEIDKHVSWKANDSAILAMVHDEVDAQARYGDLYRIKDVIEEHMGAPAQIGETFAGIPAEVDLGLHWGGCLKDTDYFAGPYVDKYGHAED